MFPSYAESEYWIASAQLALAMFGMGAVLAPADFVAVVRMPRALVLGLALQIVVVPPLALLVGAVAPVPQGIAAGLVLVAAVPGGTMSNLLTYLGGGNVPLSIALTAIATVASLATTPLLLRLLLGAHLPESFAMPVARIAFEITAILLVPLALGMWAGLRLPSHRQPLSRWSIRASLAFIVLIALGAAGSGRLDISAYGIAGPLTLVVFAIVIVQAAKVTAHLAGLGAADRLALAIEVAVRNGNLAVLLTASLFPVVAGVADPLGNAVFFVALLYGGVGLGTGLVLALRSRWGGRRRLGDGHARPR